MSFVFPLASVTMLSNGESFFLHRPRDSQLKETRVCLCSKVRDEEKNVRHTVISIHHDDSVITRFRSRFPLSESDTAWSDSDDGSEYLSDEFLTDEATSDDEPCLDTGGGSDTKEHSAMDVPDDDIDFDEDTDMTDVTSPTPVALPPDVKDLYQLLLYINELLKRIRGMVKFIRKSILIDSQVREKMASIDDQKELICGLRIRWNST